ncbi:hypothetical protein Bbelb_063520 [Branchiostoma belcheri]|nr:hypothetical protein Bbelb_063520 [Branchiostoma belcheri]
MAKLLFRITALLVAAAVLGPTRANPCRSAPASVLTCEGGTSSNGDTCTLCTRTGGDDLQECWDLSEQKRYLDIPPSYLVDWYNQVDSVSTADGAIDCDYLTSWQTAFTLVRPWDRHWMILDLQTTHTLYEISIENHGWDLADVASFLLESSSVDPYDWKYVTNSDSVQIATIFSQYFQFRGTGRYWKITVWTADGWNVWFHDVCFYGHAVSPVPCPQLQTDCALDGSPQVVASEVATGQPCHVSVDIHEGVRSKDNPLQVSRSAELTLHGLASYNCDGPYEASAIWIMPGNDDFTDVQLDLLPDLTDVYPDRLHLTLPAKTMPLGTFLLQLKVTMVATGSSHVSVGVAQTYVSFGWLPIAPTLGSAARTVDDGDFWVNADQSWDPDGLIPSSDFTYTWTCDIVYIPDPTPLECIDVLENILIHDGSRYKVYTDSETASNAEDECAKESGHLASPTDQAEWEAILHLNDCVGGGTRTIGVMDTDGDGQWSLSDGTQVTWSAWAPGYPSAPAADACAQVTSSGWSDDVSCSTQNEFICELPISDDCMVSPERYRGAVNYTIEGRDCQAWGSASPHLQTLAYYTSVQEEPAVGNKCRDPSGDGVWCYTMDAGKRWENCPVPYCAHKIGLLACGNILGVQDSADADPDAGRLHIVGKSDRQVGAIIKISVAIEAEGRPTKYSFVNIHVGTSSLDLSCKRNCNPDSHVISEELHLESDGNSDGNGYWTLVESPADFPGLDWSLDVSRVTGNTIKVRPDVFWAAGNYTLRITDDSKIAEWRFRVPVNPWRSSGDPATEPCRLIPPVGISLMDQFCVTCDDYVDEYGPVQMEIKYEFIPSGVLTPTVAFPGDEPPTVIDFILSLFTGWVGYTYMVDIAPGTVILILRAFSFDGRYTEVHLPPIVISPPTLAQLSAYMLGLYADGEGTFYTSLMVGATEDAFLSAVTVSGVIGVLADSGVDVQELITETIENMNQVPLEDIESVMGVASVLLLVTPFPDQLTPESTVSAASALKSAFVALRALSGDSSELSVGAVNRAAGSMFSAVGNVFTSSQTKALAEREAGISNSVTLEASKNATTIGFEGLDVLDDIMLNALMPEFNETKDQEMIQRQNRTIREERVYQVGGVSDCLIRVPSLPPLIGNQCPPGETVGVQFYESNFNPFEYSNNSNEVQSDIPGLSVKCGNQTLQVSDLGEPIDILTRRENTSLDDFMFIFKRAAPLGELSTFLFFAKTSRSSFGILVEFNSTLFPQPVTMVLSKHVQPTTDQYNWTTTLPVPDDQLFSIKWVNGTYLTADPYLWHLSEEEMDITDGDVENMTKYYVGVQFGSDLDVGSGVVVNFTLSVFETTCVYFAEEPVHLWQSDGCSTGVMSNLTHMHCRCDHLTKFSGFVAPNPLNIQEALSANILENPAGLILVLAVFGSYLLLLLFTRKADRKDLTKVGVGILPGHRLNPRKDCQYVITVYTGFKGNAGTTAEITIVLNGFKECSPPITLRDPKRFLFEQGSVDSFLVSTEQPLGGLTHVNVWHNNAGYSPSWWFSIDEDDGKIDRIIPSASLEEMTEFRNVFLAKSSRDMSDGHLWFSIAGRPARSPFTRVQRLSCCMTLLYSTMVTNIMFFGRGDDFDPPEPLRIAGVEIDPPISLPQLMIGIQSAAIILPVNLLIVFFFRNSGKRPKTNVSSKNAAEPKTTDGIVNYSKNTPRSKEALPPNIRSTPSDYCPTNRPTVGLKIRREDAVRPAVEVPDEKDVSETSTIPWWTVYFGWLLVWGASFVAAFFTVLYTLSFGRAKAEAWVFTFVTSFFTDLFLVQPFKLMLVAMLFALLVRKPVEDENPQPAPVDDDEEYLQTDAEEVDKVKPNRLWGSATGWVRYMGMGRAPDHAPDSKSPDEERSTLPPDESVLAEARARSAEKRKRRAAVLEVVVFGLFVTAIMLTAYQERSPLAFYMTQGVKENVFGSADELPDIKDIPSFWEWVTESLIPATHSGEWYNGQARPDRMVLPDMLTHQLGTTQLRQVRLVPGQLCEIPERMQNFAPRCTVAFSNLKADTEDYIQGWIPYNDTANSTDTVPTPPPLTRQDTPWNFTFVSLSDSFPFFGKHGTYFGGGYTTALGTTMTSSAALSAYLDQYNWLDERTRAVFVELILYNPHANLFSVVSAAVEFTQLGAAFTSGEVATLRLIQQDALLLLALRGLLAAFLLFFTIKEAKSLFGRPLEYLSEFWSWVELSVILIGFGSLGVYFNAQGIIDEAAEQRRAGNTVFDIYKSAVNWFQVYTYLLAFLICCATLKLIRLLRFNSHVYALSMTIKKSFKPVLQFFFVAGIILMAFTQMGNLLFGTKLQDYKNMLTSLTSLCTMMLGAFDFHALVDGHYILGPLMFFSYQCMMQFVLLSMFMTIIMDVYAEESQDPNTDDLQMVAFLKDTTSETVDKAKHNLLAVKMRKPEKTVHRESPDPKNLNKFAVILEELGDTNRL